MNEQLLCHLAAFDADADLSDSPKLGANEYVESVLYGILRKVNMQMLHANAFFNRFFQLKYENEAIVRLGWILPFGLVLRQYVGLFLGFGLSLILLVIIVLQPGKQQKHADETIELLNEINRRGEATEGNNDTASQEQLRACRQQVSRLMGLLGAPPLAWISRLDSNSDLAKEPFSPVQCSSKAGQLIAPLLEAHVQFLLAVDEGYQWLQMSARLHLGLGSRSQCVERVERASIAREIRNGRWQGIDRCHVATEETMDPSTKPQRGRCKSVLSLCMVRKHLAKSLIDQSISLLQVRQRLHEDLELGVHGIAYGGPPLFPDVVDLIWIKRSRQELATILSDIANTLCAPHIYGKLTSSDGIRSIMEASMENARNAREYLSCQLLLGACRTASPFSNPKNPFLMSLLQYKEEVDALSAAVWACQQHAHSAVASNELGRCDWWKSIRNQSRKCQAMESEIECRFLSIPCKEDEVTPSDDSTHDQAQVAGATEREFKTNHEFDRVGSSVPSEKTTDEIKAASKTLIFVGHGWKEEHQTHPVAQKAGRTDGQTAMILPPRDMMLERQMIQELQNRLRTIHPFHAHEEDGDEVKFEAAQHGRELLAPLFLGASGSLLGELRQTIAVSSLDAFDEHVIGE